MLVLSRKIGEKILIGDSIVLTVVKIDRNQIRIGMEVPPETAIYREEIAPSRLTAARLKNKFTDWSIRYHTTEPTGEYVRLGVAELHTAFPGSTITIEPMQSGGEALDIIPPPGTSETDIKIIRRQAINALRRIFQQYLPYHGWTIHYHTNQPQSPTVRRRIYALERRFPGAKVKAERSELSRDHLVIEHAIWATSDAKLSAYEAAKEAMNEATSARVEELRHSDNALLRLMIKDILNRTP